MQQTKWYRGVFHTRCAVYVKAFVFDGSSQMERTQEDGAFFTPCRPMPLTFAGCQERKEVKTMNTLVIVLIAAVCLFGAYMLYGRWLANK